MLSWSSLPLELLLPMIGSSDILPTVYQVCTQWRHAAYLIHYLDHVRPTSNANFRHLCRACPGLTDLRFATDLRISDKACAGLSLLSNLRTISLPNYACTAELTMGALGRIRSLTNLDVSWCGAMTDGAVINIAASSAQLRVLCMRGCRRISDSAMTELLMQGTTLTQLDLSFCSQIGDKSVSSMVRMQLLTSLRMRTIPKLSNSGARWIGALTTLKELDMSHCTEFDAEGVSTWTSLRHLQIATMEGCTGVNSVAISHLLASWPDLESIDICNIPHLQDQAVCDTLPTLTRLRSVDISHNPLLTERTVSRLSHLTNITELSACALSGVAPKSFAGILSLSRLASLCLHENKALPAALLAALPRHLSSLTHLGLRNCCSHDAMDVCQVPSDLISGLQSGIRHLDLSYSNFVAIPKAASRCAHLDALSCLQVCGCSDVTDDTLRRIAELRNLHTLDMGKCIHVTDEGMMALSVMSKLAVLHMHDCDSISDRGLSVMSRLVSLVSLDVSGCKISDEGVCCMHLPALRLLNVLRCGGPLSDMSIRHLGSTCTSLTCLHAPFTEVKHASSLACMSGLRCLEQLDLQHLSTEVLSGVATLTSLSSLVLSNVNGCSSYLTSLSALRLETLQIFKCPELDPIDLVNGLQICTRLSYVAILDCPRVTVPSLAPLSARCATVQEMSISLPQGDDPMHALDALQTLFPAALLSVYIAGSEVSAHHHS